MVRGLDAYQEIYADARKWITAGGWTIWRRNSTGRPTLRTAVRTICCDGGSTRTASPATSGLAVHVARRERFAAAEIIDEVNRTRSQPGASGNVHFSMTALLADQDGVATRRAGQTIWSPALVPASPAGVGRNRRPTARGNPTR